MSFSIKEVKKDQLKDYQQIPMINQADSIYELKELEHGLVGIIFEEIQVKPFEIDMT